MQLNSNILRRIFPEGRNNEVMLPHLSNLLPKYDINTPLRIAHFLAQIGQESSQMNILIENLNYSYLRLLKVFPRYFNVKTAYEYARKPEKIANRVYNDKYRGPKSKLGNTAEGDGWKFRGRGLKQCTGRSNYERFAKFIDKSLDDTIAYLETPEGAVLSAVWYWHERRINALADWDNLEAVTRAVNGGLNGLKDRRIYLQRAKAALGL